MQTIDMQLQLQDHFKRQYEQTVLCRLTAHAYAENHAEVSTYLSGIPHPFFNPVFGYPQKNQNTFIEEKLEHFNNANLPFVWYITESEGEEFKQKLLAKGFKSAGVFQGVSGSLENCIEQPSLPLSYTLEAINTIESLYEFGELVSSNFGIMGVSREMFHQLLKKSLHNTDYNLLHWGVRKNGIIVSCVSTFIVKEMVSFWNGSTIISERKKGLSTAIRKFALHHAIKNGCTVGCSYLMPDSLALGICTQLGYNQIWAFNAFISPESI